MQAHPATGLLPLPLEKGKWALALSTVIVDRHSLSTGSTPIKTEGSGWISSS
jgi:hypothetical protein